MRLEAVHLVLFKRLGLVLCFLAVMMAVSFALPPGFLLPKADKPVDDNVATVVSLDPRPASDECILSFDLAGDILPVVEPLSSCSEYKVGDKVRV